MIIIDLDNPNKHECEVLFKLDYTDEFYVKKGCMTVMAWFNKSGSVSQGEGNGFDLTGDQIYDILAFAADEIAESEAYWYESPGVHDVDEECAEYHGHLSNRELDGRFEGNW